MKKTGIKEYCPHLQYLKKMLLVMKLSLIITLIFALNASASVYSQATKLSMKVSKGTMEELIEEIRNQSEFKFLYSHEEIEQIKDLNLKVTNATVEQILDQALKNHDYDYKVVNDVVIITPAPGKNKSVNTQPAESAQKKITFTGKVSDDKGNPVPFAAVVLKGTTLGAATDENGKFTLEVKEDKYTAIIASSVGLLSQELAIDGKTHFEFKLKSDVSSLEEVLVTGYATISRERATGAFDKVSVEQIEKPASNISERLVGMLAGVQTTVRADGKIDIEVRGKSSFSGDGQPLVIVDGFPIEGSFSSINPNNVESVTVLKDAAAASIWGAKSANGVIVVTTKQAKKGQARIEFSSFWKVSPKLDLDYVNPRATSAETIEYEKRGFDSDLFGGLVVWGLPDYSKGDVSLGGYSQAVIAMNEHKLGRITESEKNATLARLAGYSNKQQIKDNLLQTPFIQQYNLNISGGNDRMSSSLSALFENSKDYFKENNVDKALVNFTNRVEVAKWLNFDFTGMMQYNTFTTNGASLSEINALQPYDMLIDENGNHTNLNNQFYYTPTLNNLVPRQNFPYSDWSYNPIAEIKSRNLNTNEINARITAGLEFKLIEGLTYNTRILYERYSRSTKNVYDENSFMMRQMINETSAWDMKTDVVKPAMPNGGALKQYSSVVKNYNFRNQLNFVRNFADKHAINFVAGTEISSRIVEAKSEPDVIGYSDDKLSVGRLISPYTSATKMWTGYPITYAQYFYPINLDAKHGFSYSTSRYFSAYANMAYTYHDKYTVSSSARTDASNLITDDPKYRYSPFWSAGLGWQMGKEDFLANVKWLNRLNVRGTYGFNGNVDRSTSFMPLISVNSLANIYTNEITATVSSFGNPTLRWEKTRSVDFGVDFAVLSSKLNGSIDVYHRLSKDLIVSQSIASINGTTSQRFNNGKMVNKGIELSINSSLPIAGENIIWNGNLNFAYNNNKITKFYKASYSQSDLYRGGDYAYTEGHNSNTMWGLNYAGVQNLGTEADPKMGPTVSDNEGKVYSFLSWLPGSNAHKYFTDQGTLVAPVVVGFQNSFKIYNFDLSFIITGKFGHVYRRQGFNYPSMSRGNTNVNNKYSEVKDADPSKVVTIPENERRYYFWDRFHPYLSYLTETASHIRIQEVSLSYNLPKTLCSKAGLNGVRFYAQANNLGVIVFNGFGEDPEYPVGTLRPQSAYTLGVKINL